MSCFIDTSAFLAVMNRDDAMHGRAGSIWRLLIQERWDLHTSSYVLVETFALCQNRLGLKAAQSFHADVEPLLHVTWVGAELHRAGAAAVLAAGRKKLSLVDCVSFKVMRQLGIHKAFAFDRHFKDQGFTLL